MDMNLPDKQYNPLDSLRFQINSNHFYMEEHRGVVDLRVLNISTKPIEKLQLSLDGDLFPKKCNRILHLQPGKAAVRKISIRPNTGDAGENLLEIKLRWQDGKELQCICAQHTINVLEKSEKPANIKLDMSGWFGGQIEKFGFGQEFSVNVQDLIKEGVLNTANDLLRKQLPANWQDIELSMDYESLESHKSRITVHEHFGDRFFKTDSASLILPQDTGHARYLLLSKMSVSFGRRSDSDIILRVLPSSEENDFVSQQISKRHFEIKISEDGIFLTDAGSTGGTFLDGTLVTGRVPLNKEKSAEIGVANALRLRITALTSRAAFCFDAFDYSAVTGRSRGELLTLAQKLSIDSLRIERLGNLEEEKYLILLRQALIGSGLDNPIIIPGAEKEHAKILYLGKQYYLENLVEPELTSIEGNAIPRQRLVPLVKGMTVVLGKDKLEFGDFIQDY